MPPLFRAALRGSLAGPALALACALPLAAETLFTPSNDGFAGTVRATAAEPGAPILAGGRAVIAGQGLIPGQELTLMRGPHVLNDAPVVVDGEGRFRFELAIDAGAATGLQPVVVIAEKPAAAMVVEVKISPDVPLSGAEKFTIASEKVTRGLYQVAWSPKAGAVFVTSAVGRPPVRESALSKVDPETLQVVAQVAPPAVEGDALYAAYGVGVDDAHGHVWVTNTRQDTVAVYRQADLGLVKQFAPGAVAHARDVVIDEARGRAYASATGTGHIEVFDTATLEQLAPIVIRSQVRGEEFSAMALDIDPAGGRLVTVSMATPEAAVVDLATGAVRVIPLPGARSASGVAYDPEEGLIFVASQASDNLLIVEAETGAIRHDVETGAGPLNVAFEPKSRLAYVANRGSGTITVVDTGGRIVANLDAGNLPNQLRADGRGHVWAVNKSRGEADPEGDRVWKITPVSQ